MIDGGVSFGQYRRSMRLNFPSGAGSQFDSFPGPGLSCCRYRSTDPSGLVAKLLR
ncbi:Uncharacterised protein [Mycobacteroides abscessus subsp. massiliense]|nr:Uncharacterised protein [Mycobacteroides abscessus subsp. massiliense]